MITNKNRYIGQLTTRDKLYKAAHERAKKWRKVKTMEDMEYDNFRMIPKYEK